MFNHPLVRLRRFTTQRLDQAAAFATWAFLVVSMGLLLSAIVQIDGDLSRIVGVASVSGSGATHHPPGLTYAGETGMLRGVLQFIIVGLAAVCTLTPFRRLARLGRGIVLAWAAWWAGNFAWLAATTGHPGAAIVAGGCVAAAAGAAWRFRRMRQTPLVDPGDPVDAAPAPGLGFSLDPDADDAPDAAPTPDLTPGDITWSDRVREVAAKAKGPLKAAGEKAIDAAARAHGRVREKVQGVAERTRAREV